MASCSVNNVPLVPHSEFRVQNDERGTGKADEKRREVWIYDKVSSDRVDTARSSYATLIIIGGDNRSGSSSTRQRTLTVIIKFDEDKRVRDFAYNYTQF